ncbi:MAG: cell division protein SepF [Clostridia bacterium]
MSFLKSFLEVFGFETEEYLEEVPETKVKKETKIQKSLLPANKAFNLLETTPSKSDFKLLSSATTKIVFSISNPRNYDDARIIAAKLVAHQPVILNLEHTEQASITRIVDFLSGVSYSLGGYIHEVSCGVYLFSPSHLPIEQKMSTLYENSKKATAVS